MGYTIKDGSEVYLGDKKAMTIVIDGEERYVELEPHEYKGVDNDMQYVESQSVIEPSLDTIVKSWGQV